MMVAEALTLVAQRPCVNGWGGAGCAFDAGDVHLEGLGK
jgi:hypothetical protein